MDATSISLTDVFRRDPSGTRFLLAENVPPGHDVELFELYFEKVCKCEVLDVRTIENEPDLLVVEFNEAISDIESVKRKARDRPLNGVVLSIDYLGCPTGLYITGMRANVSKDMLQLKFENKRSGGLDECVELVEFVHVGSGKHAYVHISNKAALKSILSIDGHQLENAVLLLQPYYPSVHEDIWTRLKLESNVAVSDDTETGAKQKQIKKRTAFASEQQRNTTNKPADRSRKPQMSHVNSALSEQDGPSNHEQVTKLRVYYENTDDQSSPLHVTTPTYTDYNDGQNQFSKCLEQPPSSKHSNEYHRPAVNKHVGGQRNIEKKPWRNRQRRSQSCGRPRDSQPCLTLPVESPEAELEEEMLLSPAKITLLIIYRFQTKNEKQSFKVTFQERNGKVIIKGHNEEDLKNARLKIHECLNQVNSISEPLHEFRHKFLSRSESKNCMRQRSKQKKCCASFEIRDSPPELLCHAFNLQQCEEALKFVFNEITVQTFELRPGQEKQLLEDSWKSLNEELDTGLTTVYIDKSDKAKIVIESFLAHKAAEARRKIIDFFKNNVPREKEEISLEGGRARCFDAHLNVQLTHTIQSQFGKLFVKTVSQDPLKFCISVEGNQRVVQALRNMEQQICSEEVDFKTTFEGLQPEEIWLFYKGLDSSYGKDFLKQFERLSDCFLDVVNDGKFVLPMKRRVVPARKSSPSQSDLVYDQSPTYEELLERHAEQVERAQAEQAQAERVKRAHLMKLKRMRTAIPRPSQTQTLNIGGVSVFLKQGQIVNEQADALINIVSSNHEMGESVLSKEFIKKAGTELIMIHKLEVNRMKDEMSYVIATDSVNMVNCSTILHVALKKGEPYCRQMIAVVMREIFGHCKSRRCRSVAIPPLGVGRMYKYPPDKVVQLMLSAIKTEYAACRIQILQSITIVTYDTDTHREFENGFQSFDSSQQSTLSVGQSQNAFYKMAIDQQRILATPARRPVDVTTYEDHVTSRPSSAYTQDLEPKMKQRVVPKPAPRVSRVPEDKPVARVSRVPEDKPVARVSRVPEDKPVARLKVTVTTLGRSQCVVATKDLGQKIKEEFLYTETLEKKANVSNEAKQKIDEILVSNDVRSFKVGDRYVLKGQKDKVNSACKEIYQVLLEDKQTLKSVPKRLANVRPGTTKFVSMMIDLEPNVPEYWQVFKPGVSIRNLLKEGRRENVQKVLLRSSSPEYLAIHQMFNCNIEPSKVGQGQDAIGISYTRLNIVQIQRIENLSLYEQFARKRIELYQKLHTAEMVGFPKIENLLNCTGPIATAPYMNPVLKQDIHQSLNEFLLFHGTKPELMEVICNGGFDERRGSGRAMFGQGIYGAEKSMKADQYTDTKHGRISGQGQQKYMFLMRMLLGNSYLCTNINPPKYCRPPCTSCYDDKCNHHDHVGPLGHIFDSVTGDNGKLFREFVVYDRNLCYPEYLITYERI